MNAARSLQPVRRLAAPALVAVVAGAGALAVAVRDPHVSGSWGVCPFLLVTGHPCPLCGGLRATNDLLRGDVGAAAGSNALVLLALPVLAAWLLVWSVRLVRDGDAAEVPVPSRRLLVAAAVVVVGFGVIRWLLPFAELAP